MASLWKNPRSRFWIACFTDSSGKRLKRSTKTVDRRTALKMADAWETAACKNTTRAQAQRVMADIFGEASQNEATVRSWFRQWLDEIRPTVSIATHQAYTNGVDHWLAFMGSRADMALIHLGRADVAKYRASLEKGHPNTGNQRLKLLKMVLQRARESGNNVDDVFAGLKMFRTREATEERRPFTMDELKAALAAADAEWRSMILIGVTLGIRLGDICALTWRQIDFDKQEVSLVVKKTGRNQRLPLSLKVIESLGRLPLPHPPASPVHSRAAGLVAGAKGKVSTVSRQFRELLVEAKVITAAAKGHESTGKGRNSKRTAADVSFHSLRHTSRTLLEASGVSLKTAMEMLGHADAAMSLKYSHSDAGAMRRALDSLPDIG